MIDSEAIDNLWDYSNPAKTETAFRKLINQYPLNSTEIKTQIARALGLQRKFDDAHKILDEVLEELDGEIGKISVRYHLERGRLYNSNNQKEEAIEQFKMSLEQAQELNLAYYAVDAAHMLGIAAPNSEQLEWNELAIDLAEKSEESRAKKWLASLYNNQGWTYHDKQEYDKALKYFENALEERVKLNQLVPILIAKWCIARTERSLGNIDKALELQLDLLNDYEKSEQKNSGYVFEELGECYYALKNEALASKYFKKAYESLSQDQWLVANEKDRLDRLASLGNCN